ncbi:MAG: hypothetical protein IT208_04900 [Chthonomonadales bacterium]|nr:hypothetical protein [Chthonomonadales bacterium]
MANLDDDALIRLGVNANLAARLTEDQRGLVDYLAAMLEAVLPEQTTVDRRGGLFSGKRVRTVRVRIDDDLYAIEARAGHPLVATRTRVVRGVKLKTETLEAGRWLRELEAALAGLAERSRATRDALQRFAGGEA